MSGSVIITSSDVIITKLSKKKERKKDILHWPRKRVSKIKMSWHSFVNFQLPWLAFCIFERSMIQYDDDTNIGKEKVQKQ